jgi:hypothetical protein
MSQILIISLYAIAVLESGLDPGAINKRTQAYGMYQIRQPCLEDYNRKNKAKWTLEDMLTPSIAREVADWYLNKEIPRLLRHYKQDTIDNRLAAYNWGIGNMRKGKALPKETVNYIRKYKELTNG